MEVKPMKLKKILIIAMTIMFIVGCSGKEKTEALKIKDIQEKEGIPVKIKNMKPETLIVSKRYTGTLRGKEEATASAGIGGNIEKIHVKVGQHVAKDQIIAEFRKDAPSSQYRQAKAAFDNSLENLKRIEKLYEAGAVSKQTLDNMKTQHDVNIANYEATERQIFVKAPIAGYIGDIFVNEGDGIQSEGAIATITDLRQLSLKINVPENDIALINKNTTAYISTNDIIEPIKADIARIALTANPRTRSFEIELDVPNSENKLRSGMIVEVELNIIEKPNTFFVLRENLISQNNENYLYVVENDRAMLKKVETGILSGLIVEITSGIKDDDVIVVSGGTLLSEGSLVKIVN